MRLLHAGTDTSVIALWLGHENVETTQVYLHADLAIKGRALASYFPAQNWAMFSCSQNRPVDGKLQVRTGSRLTAAAATDSFL
jgi:hypothetical protein